MEGCRLIRPGHGGGRACGRGSTHGRSGCKLVSGADGAEAVAAVGFELKVALGAEVEVALDVGGARRAAGDDGLAEEEVEDSANSARHDKADDDPEAGAHGAAGGVFADVADHEEVEGGEEAPGEVEVDAEAERRGRMGRRRGEPARSSTQPAQRPQRPRRWTRWE